MTAVPALLVFWKFSVPSSIRITALPAVLLFWKLTMPPSWSVKNSGLIELLTMPVPVTLSVFVAQPPQFAFASWYA